VSFAPDGPDRALSPFTGLTRKHWVDAARWLLDGVFAHIPRVDAPFVLPRRETKITYPQPGDPSWRRNSEIMEGVARTLLVAAPLLRHDPGLVSHGLALRDYYAAAILRLADPKSPEYVGDRAAMVAVWGDRPIQVTCECASLALGLTQAREAIWNRYTQAERDIIARLFHAWGHCRTHAHNWRLFNIHILSFLQREGYAIDRAVLEDHLRVVRSFDAGDGWYRDGTYFDYYSVWAFQFYLPLWVAWSGYADYPELADAFERSTQKLLATYDRFFDRDGHQPMWGRSNIYRFTAAAPFGAAFFLKNAGIAPGAARRVMSGNLLQFLSHPQFRDNGVPTLGFYGQFPPLVQPYSCAASPFWFGNTFQALALPADHPLWTAREEAGGWDGLAGGAAVRETALPGPGLQLAQHAATGATEMRTSKVMVVGGHKVLHNYSRLAFNTKFPWQADTADGLMAMHYNLKVGGTPRAPNLLFHSGERGGVCYRRLLFDFTGSLGDNSAIDLADFPVAHGLVRCDRLRIPEPDTALTLCHYGLPLPAGNDCRTEEREVGDGRALLVSAGDRQLALVRVHGWEGFLTRREAGLHPDAEESVLPGLTSHRAERYQGEPLRITLMLHRCDARPWRDEELWPFSKIDIRPWNAAGSAPVVEFTLSDGTVRRVDYQDIEGTLGI
jgi:hypothetical protein